MWWLMLWIQLTDRLPLNSLLGVTGCVASILIVAPRLDRWIFTWQPDDDASGDQANGPG
jgi:hypothetical protein